jgi:signal transduction histidine kinase/CheY-like chemotaxis protein
LLTCQALLLFSSKTWLIVDGKKESTGSESSTATAVGDTDPDAEQLLTEARRRRFAGLGRREWLVRWLFAIGFLAVAVPVALFAPTARTESPLLFFFLEVAFAISSRIKFEVGSGVTIPTQLVLVPMFFVLPAGQVPIAVALGLVLGHIPEFFRRELPLARISVMIGNAWYSLGPALVFLAFGEPEARAPSWGVLLLALVAQLATDFTSAAAREWFALGIRPRQLLEPLLLVLMSDALLTPVGLAAALASVVTKVVLFFPISLLGLMWLFAREHKQRLDQTLELTLVNATLEEQASELRQAQKMEAVGQLAGGIAHDFNNLLTVISGYTELLLRRFDRQAERSNEVEAISKAAESAAGLTRQLLAFSRKKSLNPRPLDLNAAVTETQTMLERLIGEDIEFSTALAADLGAISADSGQIEQIIINLVVNAQHAMPLGGKLAVKTDNLTLASVAADRRPDAPPGDYVQLTLSDTGEGMDTATVQQIFDPFFTTKEVGVGTGLGLSTVYGIVKQCGGQIEVDSEPGVGTTFRLYFPRSADIPEVLDLHPSTDERSLHGSETVLLVEDAEALRILGKEILEIYGYTVLIASDGAEALELAQSHPNPIEVVMTDIRMPGLGGIELAQRLTTLQSNLKVIYVSGDAETGDHTGETPGSRFLEKPYEIDDLARTLRELLDPM